MSVHNAYDEKCNDCLVAVVFVPPNAFRLKLAFDQTMSVGMYARGFTSRMGITQPSNFDFLINERMIHLIYKLIECLPTRYICRCVRFSKCFERKYVY